MYNSKDFSNIVDSKVREITEITGRYIKCVKIAKRVRTDTVENPFTGTATDYTYGDLYERIEESRDIKVSLDWVKNEYEDPSRSGVVIPIGSAEIRVLLDDVSKFEDSDYYIIDDSKFYLYSKEPAGWENINRWKYILLKQGTKLNFDGKDSTIEELSGQATYANFTASAPLAYDYNTGVISIVQAGVSTNGYLSSTDWNTFAAKQNPLTFGDISSTTSGVTVTNGVDSTVGPNVSFSIALVTSQVAESGNLYYTNARAKSYADTLYSVLAHTHSYTTSNIPEGTNQYWTSGRFNTALAAKTTDDLAEGSTNKYFTNEKVDDRVATLIQAGGGITWTYVDSAGTLTPGVNIPEANLDIANGPADGYTLKWSAIDGKMKWMP